MTQEEREHLEKCGKRLEEAFKKIGEERRREERQKKSAQRPRRQSSQT